MIKWKGVSSLRRTGGSNKTKREGVSNAKKYGYGGGVGPPDPLYSHLTLLVDKLWNILIGTREKGLSILVYRMYSTAGYRLHVSGMCIIYLKKNY
jgi:hypothetical protein